MLNAKAPNGLLVRREAYPNGPCGVGWTSDPASAADWEDDADALEWADYNAPALAVALRVGIADPGPGYNGDAVRLVPASGAP